MNIDTVLHHYIVCALWSSTDDDGFWDRGLGNIGDELTKVCHSYGDVYLYISDNEKVCQ